MWHFRAEPVLVLRYTLLSESSDKGEGGNMARGTAVRETWEIGAFGVGPFGESRAEFEPASAEVLVSRTYAMPAHWPQFTGSPPAS